ncbi:arylsulfatase [Thermostilla marina]
MQSAQTLKRSVFVALLSLTAFTAGAICSQSTAQEPSRPNIVIIMADDMGFSDLGCYGGEIETPHIDSLAATGLRYTQFYNTSRCWTTRVSLLTGLYHHYAEDIHMGRRKDAATRLLPELLKPLGYRTYHTGKWHIRGEVAVERGFDHTYQLDDHNRNFYPQRHQEDGKPLPPVTPGSNYYTTTAITDYGLKYLKEHAEKYRDRPFFLYVAYTTPHFPLHAPPEDIARYRDRYLRGWDEMRKERWQRMRKMGIVDCPLSPRDPDIIPSWNLPEDELQAQIGPGECGHAVAWDSLTEEQKRFQATKMAIHAAMVHRIDTEVGRILDQLDGMGMRNDTLIIVLSDNGASAEQIIRGDRHDPTAAPGSGPTFLCLGPGWSTFSNTPFRLHKSWEHEGGIATPFIVSWPKGIRDQGALRHAVGHVIDIVPTIVELTGVALPDKVNGLPVARPHGVSLLNTFADDVSVDREFLFWEHIGNKALRMGDWKIVARADCHWELYNLAEDRSETNDLAASMPEKTAKMAEIWEKFAAEIMLGSNRK